MSNYTAGLGNSGSGKRRIKDLFKQPDNRVCALIVLSVTQDEWSDEEVDSMIEYASASSIYEAFVPEGSYKPGPDVSHDQRMRFIRSKYEHQEFLRPSLRITSGKACSTKKPSFLNSSISTKFMDSFRAHSSSKKIEGMVEFIGLLKVTVKKGTNLAIRVMMSSDPYVVLNLGRDANDTTTCGGSWRGQPSSSAYCFSRILTFLV
ncbi:hypothetical protein BRARA_I03059 [Brassica rapa]|uniref:C2 domain-containing protein n=1 Tax=Brassica campestris TaxID=3711 RepID=A0A397XYJ7_BRACM|nr:hypothetical protein BRARA_I03059 [Brassica rapa]